MLEKRRHGDACQRAIRQAHGETCVAPALLRVLAFSRRMLGRRQECLRQKIKMTSMLAVPFTKNSSSELTRSARLALHRLSPRERPAGQTLSPPRLGLLKPTR